TPAATCSSPLRSRSPNRFSADLQLPRKASCSAARPGTLAGELRFGVIRRIRPDSRGNRGGRRHGARRLMLPQSPPLLQHRDGKAGGEPETQAPERRSTEEAGPQAVPRVLHLSLEKHVAPVALVELRPPPTEEARG